jgi:hypothetical protein
MFIGVRYLGAEEGRELVGDKKHVETWPVDKKM